LAWSFDEEPAASDHVLDHVRAFGALAPTLFAYEVANVLTTAMRRKRIDALQADAIGEALDALRIAFVAPDSPDWRRATMALANRHNLTFYDASYLQLAIRAGALLATADRALSIAAQEHGIAFGCR